jgi:hypothetical protein
VWAISCSALFVSIAGSGQRRGFHFRCRLRPRKGQFGQMRRPSESGDFAAFRIGQRCLGIGRYGFPGDKSIDNSLH